MSLLEITNWIPVCATAALIPDRGRAAMVDGEQVAVFRLATGELFAVDPADVLSTGGAA